MLENDERLLFLPLCHVAERIGGYYYSLATGSIMNFAESPETVPDNIREVQPTAFLAVPRVWEKFYSAIMIALKDATPLEKWIYSKAIAVGYELADTRLEGRRAVGRCRRRNSRSPTGWRCATSARRWASTAANTCTPARRRSRRN